MTCSGAHEKYQSILQRPAQEAVDSSHENFPGATVDYFHHLNLVSPISVILKLGDVWQIGIWWCPHWNMTVITVMSEPTRADKFTNAQWFSRRPVKAPNILVTALLHFLVFTVASSKKPLSSTFIMKVFSSMCGCAPSQIARAWRKKNKIAGLTHSHLEVIYSFPCTWPKCLRESGRRLEQKEGNHTDRRWENMQTPHRWSNPAVEGGEEIDFWINHTSRWSPCLINYWIHTADKI